MSTVISNADELDDFASGLEAFSHELADQSSLMRARFRRLGETWRDPQYARFAQEFEQTMRNLERFVGIADEIVPRLHGTAQRIRDVYR
jgi:uncharacterized protein YukE